MNKTEARKRIAKLRADIQKHNHAYYDKGTPLISDAAYDELTQELKALEAQYPDLITSDSPTQHVNGVPYVKFSKTNHAVPLLSLRDVFNKDEVTDWYQSMFGKIVTVEDKVDGLSLAVTYIDGKFSSAATRGDGITGEDVTENVRVMDSVPKILPDANPKSKIIVRCEVYMPFDMFEKINAERNTTGETLFKNVRNAAAGSLRTNDPTVTHNRGPGAPEKYIKTMVICG